MLHPCLSDMHPIAESCHYGEETSLHFWRLNEKQEGSDEMIKDTVRFQIALIPWRILATERCVFQDWNWVDGDGHNCIEGEGSQKWAVSADHEALLSANCNRCLLKQFVPVEYRPQHQDSAFDIRRFYQGLEYPWHCMAKDSRDLNIVWFCMALTLAI